MAGATATATATTTTNTTTTVATTVVTAVAAAGVYALTPGTTTPLLCPTVIAPDRLPGQVSFDILGLTRRPNATEALQLANSFVAVYDRAFGCDSTFSRRMINCTLPCTVVVDDDDDQSNTTTGLLNVSSFSQNVTRTQCCEELFDQDDSFGSTNRSLVQCTFSCFVHCVGCPMEEPLFLVPPLSPEDFGNNNNRTPVPAASAVLLALPPEPPSRRLDEEESNTTTTSPLDDDDDDDSAADCMDVLFNGNTTTWMSEKCSALALLGQAIEQQLCSNNSPEDEDYNCKVIRGTVYVNQQGMDDGSSSFSFSSAANNNNTANGTDTTTITTNFQPESRETFIPVPTIAPTTAMPSAVPSSQPTPFFLTVELYDEHGFYFGAVEDEGLVLSSSSTTAPAWTIRVEAPSNVQSVVFELDHGDRTVIDRTAPFYLAGQADVPFPPLTGTVGTHTLQVRAYNDERNEIGSRTLTYTVVSE